MQRCCLYCKQFACLITIPVVYINFTALGTRKGSLFLRFNGHFPGEPGLAGVY